MLSYIVFDAERIDDWYTYLHQIDEKDIYFDPKYCQIYEKNGEGKAVLFVYEEDGYIVYYPFLLRKLNDLPHLQHILTDRDYFDIVTPYGYGGPISNAKDEETKRKLFARFRQAFSAYCGDHHIVTEFIRFHPLLANYQYDTDVDITFVRNTVYVDLHIPVDEITKRYSSQNRNKIRKAEKHGLVVRHASIEELDHFLALYYETMDKNNAADYYYFTKQFFAHTLTLLAGNVQLVFIQYEDKVVSAGIFMHDHTTVHYHFSGSDKRFLHVAPNNLLLDYMIKWAKQKGCQYVHLGGGYTGNDDLYKFKKNFNKYGDLPFYVGKKIRNERVYEMIKEQLCLPASSSFFPIYRDPTIRVDREGM